MLFNNLVKINLENKNSHLDLFLIDTRCSPRTDLGEEIVSSKGFNCKQNLYFKTHCHVDIPKISAQETFYCIPKCLPLSMGISNFIRQKKIEMRQSIKH